MESQPVDCISHQHHYARYEAGLSVRVKREALRTSKTKVLKRSWSEERVHRISFYISARDEQYIVHHFQIAEREKIQGRSMARFEILARTNT